VPHKFDPANRARLESPERLALLPVEQVIALAQVKGGERVLDLGCGPGVFTALLARAVGESGQVFAADVEPEMVQACEERIEALGFTNVAVGRSEENAIPLPAGSVDLVFACHLLHELQDPAALLAEVRRVLRPGGRLAAVEWEKVETGGVGPPVEARLTPEDSRALLEGNGFTVTGTGSVTWANYLLLARPCLPVK
jgi:SAM-dependent methyltransferase